MTIKDVERQTGITKANIRFYEAQGLIQPERTDSGYRSYSAEDVEELKRVRLLRLLDVPMEQVKALQQGKASLDGVLAGQLVQIQEEKKRLSDVTQVIRQIRQNGEEYPSLEPEPYLERLKGRETQDALISDRHPWRRYWARTLDSGLIGVWMLAAFPGALEGGGKLFQMQFLALSLAAQILLEPLLLWSVGGTPGKLLLGIRVTGREGERLTFRRAVGRTFGVLTYGQAFCVPTLREIRGYVCLRKAEDGELLPWEQDSRLDFKKLSAWRYALAVLTFLAMGLFALWTASEQWFGGMLAR